ncbi:PqqD family protein [Clostridium oryzae]|uniref:Coenzyme PQQ synthesis protein D n=1 Tax=Clostridium oryzae TaxID=1450648 RepID=A0A1V4I470_9CLOT|nr:PqqD family protein [Clostridium oryzae]OPJ54778.1 coenzyme PQQ synthesis protein D [Clostridium oryzae]
MVYIKSEDIYWAFKEGLAVVKDSTNDLFFPLDDVGSLIWDMIDGVNSVEDIATEIVSEFDIDEETAKEDLLVFINELMDYQLIRIVETEKSM